MVDETGNVSHFLGVNNVIGIDFHHIPARAQTNAEQSSNHPAAARQASDARVHMRLTALRIQPQALILGFFADHLKRQKEKTCKTYTKARRFGEGQS